MRLLPNRRKYLLVVVAIILTVCASCSAVSSPSPRDKPIVLKFVDEESPADVQGLYASRFKKLVEQRTDGRVRVEIYSAGQLGQDKDHLKLVQDNAVQMAISTPSITSPIIPENGVLSIPFTFSQDMSVNRHVLKDSNALNVDLAGIYKDRGIEALSFWTEGFMTWSSSQPITSPAEMKGLKIRTMTSPVVISAYRSLGANPTPMDAGEIYTALQTGMIDATVNPAFFIYSGGTYQVQDYFTIAHPHIYITSTLANKEFLASLPSDIRSVVTKTVDQLEAYSFRKQKQLNADAITSMQKADIDVVSLSPSQRQKYRSLARENRQQYLSLLGGRGERIFDKLTTEISQAESGH